MGKILAENSKKKTKTVVTYLSPSELPTLVDREAQAKLGISGKEFIRRFMAGEVSLESPNERSVAFVAKQLTRTKKT